MGNKNRIHIDYLDLTQEDKDLMNKVGGDTKLAVLKSFKEENDPIYFYEYLHDAQLNHPLYQLAHEVSNKHKTDIEYVQYRMISIYLRECEEEREILAEVKTQEIVEEAGIRINDGKKDSLERIKIEHNLKKLPDSVGEVAQIHSLDLLTYYRELHNLHFPMNYFQTQLFDTALLTADVYKADNVNFKDIQFAMMKSYWENYLKKQKRLFRGAKIEMFVFGCFAGVIIGYLF